MLTFPAPEAGAKARRVEGLTLTLVQTLPKFAKEGKVKFFLVDAEDPDPKTLKFAMESPGGLGDQFKGRHPLGTGEFKGVENGKARTFDLSLDEAAGKALKARLEAKGDILLLIVPDDDGVAATYYGAGEEEAGRKPRLAFKFASP